MVYTILIDGPGSNLIDGPGSNLINGPGSNLIDGPGSNLIDGPGSNLIDGPGSNYQLDLFLNILYFNLSEMSMGCSLLNMGNM